MLQGGSLWAGLITGGLYQWGDTNQLNQGQMNRQEYAAHTTKNVTAAVGVMAGVEYGAILGTTLIPGIGTAVGAVAGGILGDRVGQMVGGQLGSQWVPKAKDQKLKDMVNPLQPNEASQPSYQ